MILYNSSLQQTFIGLHISHFQSQLITAKKQGKQENENENIKITVLAMATELTDCRLPEQTSSLVASDRLFVATDEKCRVYNYNTL